MSYKQIELTDSELDLVLLALDNGAMWCEKEVQAIRNIINKQYSTSVTIINQSDTILATSANDMANMADAYRRAIESIRLQLVNTQPRKRCVKKVYEPMCRMYAYYDDQNIMVWQSENDYTLTEVENIINR